MPEDVSPQAMQLTIPAATVQALRDIAARQNIPLATALEQAVNVTHLLVAGSGAGAQILLKRGRAMQELKFAPGAQSPSGSGQ
jgi:hypothetical protein